MTIDEKMLGPSLIFIPWHLEYIYELIEFAENVSSLIIRCFKKEAQSRKETHAHKRKAHTEKKQKEKHENRNRLRLFVLTRILGTQSNRKIFFLSLSPHAHKTGKDAFFS